MQVLQRRWDRTFSEHSYGFRPKRSAHQAVRAAQLYVAEGYRWVVDLDLEKFFDRVNHDKLMAKIAERVNDKRMLRLIRAFLQAGVMENGLVSSVDEGTPQGGPLSPLLSNIVLDELDQELGRRHLRYARYADDSNIYVRSRRAGERVMASLTEFITSKLKLKVNQAKSAVARPWQRKFLGFSFTLHREPQRRIAPKAILRFKERIRELTRRTRGVSVEKVAEELGRYLRGWQGYFGFCQTPYVLRNLDYWTRRRLRSFLWKQWSGAAARIFRTQPAVSIALRKLEETVGTALLVRSSKRSFRLTDAGAFLYESASRMIAVRDEAVAALRGEHRGCLGRLVIGTSGANSLDRVTQLTGRFREIHPSVRIEIIADKPQQLVGLGAERRIDVAFLSNSALKQYRMTSSLSQLELASLDQALSFVLPRRGCSHVLRTFEKVVREDLRRKRANRIANTNRHVIESPEWIGQKSGRNCSPGLVSKRGGNEMKGTVDDPSGGVAPGG